MLHQGVLRLMLAVAAGADAQVQLQCLDGNRVTLPDTEMDPAAEPMDAPLQVRVQPLCIPLL